MDCELYKLNEFVKDTQYLFIISPPASGKSTFCKKYLGEYIRLSKKAENKQLFEILKKLEQGDKKTKAKAKSY